MNLFGFFKQELAVDLGTANTLIIQDGKVVVDEPSIVAINRRTNEVIAVGFSSCRKFDTRIDCYDWGKKKVFLSP